MRVRLSYKVIKQYEALSKVLRKKADKQFKYLIEDFCHPSLHAKNMEALMMCGKEE